MLGGQQLRKRQQQQLLQRGVLQRQLLLLLQGPVLQLQQWEQSQLQSSKDKFSNTTLSWGLWRSAFFSTPQVLIRFQQYKRG